MNVLFIFLDGVGIGPPTLNNPLAAHTWPALERLASDQSWTAPLRSVHTKQHVVKPIDATLGVEGLPQSGTGQATLFTGVNCAERVGRHFGPFPHSATHDVLRKLNIFQRMESEVDPIDNQSSASTFANAYPERFFEWVNGRGRWTVTTFSAIETGLDLRGTNELQTGDAVAANISGSGWPDPTANIAPITATQAADNLVRLHRKHRLTLFEYYLTDKAGHGRLDESAESILANVNDFLWRVLDRLDPAKECLVITSDHGNIEDLSQKQHTRYPVPFIALGRGAHAFENVQSLTDVTPAILRLFATETA
ncbi:peptidase [Longibacter salinarum]|uniref:Peptidase n=1 Tax=Longibacter salinarum TaxID=1850348 RepID=A0A2A8D2U4_9BACT|nr:peptidase [Longibacter salinarum]PEN15184.1 peptidase [Longibacter salinarum]